MGAGVAAVVGIENGPSSSCTTIEEAQAELRQELAGRNERRRELEFLEKGGDPLEFKLVEGSAGLWPFSQADSFGKNLLSSDGNVSYSLTNVTREDKLVFAPEDGLEFKRARSSTGKFFVDRYPTTVSPIGNSLPNSISSSLDHDRKKVPDSCKNRTAVKGQYARRNRARSNRFGNGCSVILDSGKLEAEGGSSNFSSVVKDPLLADAHRQDAIKEDQAQVSTQQNSSHGGDVTDTAEVAIYIGNSTEASLSLHKCNDQGEDVHVITRLPSNESAVKAVPEPPLQEKARDLLFCTVEAKHSVELESESTVMPILDGRQLSNEQTKGIEGIPASPRKPPIRAGSQVAEYCGDSNRNSQVPIESTSADVVLQPKENIVVAPAERIENLDAKFKHPDVSLEPAGESSNLVYKTAVTRSSSDNNISNEGFTEKTPEMEIVKIKTEEMSEAVASQLVVISDEKILDMEMPLESSKDHQKCSEEGNVNAQDLPISGNAVISERVPDITCVEEKKDASVLADKKEVKNILSVAIEKSINKEAEKSKASLQQSTDLGKRNVTREPQWKKSHWDFVLEEMAWLANDFMQERLWKVAAAAQVARWIVTERWQSELEEAEIQKRQQQIAQRLAKKVMTFWHSSEAVLRDPVRKDNVSMPVPASYTSGQTATDKVELVSTSDRNKVLRNRSLPIHQYAVRFLENSPGSKALSQAEAPSTPDRVSESGLFDFWDEKLPEESLLYTVPNYAMELYRQSIVSQWEMEYEQRLQEHEAAIAESELPAAGEAVEYTSGISGGSSFLSPVVTGKRHSGFHGSIPIKRMRTSAVASRQRAAGAAGPLVSGSAAHLGRSDISSGDTNSQQDEFATMIEGSSVLGRFTDAESTGAFMRSNMTADGVDSPVKNKKKKKIRPSNGGHSVSASYDAKESEQPRQHIAHDVKEHLKHRGEQVVGSSGLEGPGILTGMGITTSTSKLIKHINNRDRGKKYKAVKASISQPGFGVPWSSVEDQTILGLVYELGSNWELVSDILSSNSQLKGIFRKPKDCKERHVFLTERLGADSGDSPDDPSSSHLPLSLGQKGGTRFLPQHLEETLKNHVDCILQLHQRIRNRRLQNETQEKRQLVPEHESHALKHAVPLTPLELCEQAAEPGGHPCSLQATGFGMTNIMSGTGVRPNSMSLAQGSNSLQLSASVSPTAISSAVTRDAQRMGPSMRPPTAEEQRIRYNRMVAGRGLQPQGISGPVGMLPFMGLPNSGDSGATPATLSPGTNASVMGGLNRSVSLAQNNFPGIGQMGTQNIVAGVNNNLPSVGLSLPGGAAISSSNNAIRRPARDAMPMGPTQSAALNCSNSVASSPINSAQSPQQPQLMQHNTSQALQPSPSSSQVPSYNMNMRAVKDRQQLLQQDPHKRMQQQQLSPTASCSSQSPFSSSSQTLVTASQSQHISPTHGPMFPQPSHLLMQPHGLPQDSVIQQITAGGSITSPTVSAISPTVQSNGQNSQQHVTSLPGQVPLQTKPSLSKQQQQQLQGKGMKGMGRGSPIQGHPNAQPQIMSQSQQLCGQAQAPAQNLGALPDALAQQYQQKSFGKQIPMPQSTPTCSTMTSTTQPTSPSLTSSPLQAPAKSLSVPSSQQQQRRVNQSQVQQKRPQQGQLANVQAAKSGVQPRNSVPSQSAAVSQLTNSTSSIPLQSTSAGSAGATISSSQWKSGQNFSPMAGLYNLSRGNNNGSAAQAPGVLSMVPPSSNGNVTVSSNPSPVSQESKNGVQHTSGQKPTSVMASQLTGPSQRLSPQQSSQLGCMPNSPGGASQVRPASSGTTPVHPD